MYCIYKITNIVNGKTYIGQHKYKKLDDDYMGSGMLIQRALKKYGIESFKKDILVFGIVKKDFIDLLEREYIKFYRSIGRAEYNIADGGEGWSGGHHSEETKKKLSEAQKGRHRFFSEEAKRKMSEAKKGITPWNKGKTGYNRKPHSDETKKKIADANKGKHWKLVDGKRVYN